MDDNKKFISIKTKLIFILSLSALIAILISAVVLFWHSYEQNKERGISLLHQVSIITAENATASLEFDDAASAASLLKSFRTSGAIDGAYLLKADKSQFATYFRDGVDKKSVEEKMASFMSKNDIKKQAHYVDLNHIVVSNPIALNGKYLASIVVVSNTIKFNEMVRAEFYIQLFISIIVLAIVVFLAFRLQKVFTTPIFRLKEAMDDVREHRNYDAKVVFQSNDEFASLIDGFNKMLGTIKDQERQLENHTQTLNETIKLKTADIEHQKNKLEALLVTIDKNVIFSRTDLNGNIVQASEAFCEISGYTKDELIGKPHNIVRHPDMPKEAFADLWKTIQSGNVWKGEVKNQKKGDSFYWVSAVVTPEYDEEGKHTGYSSIRQDITAKKEAMELNERQKEQLVEIQRFQNLTAGREARMVELKEMVNNLYSERNRPLPFGVMDDDGELVHNEAEETKINLSEAIDLPSLQKLLDHFCNSVEIASAIIDMDGNILAASRWQKACTDFHRQNERSCANCIESDVDLSQNLQDGENFSAYKCKNGLVDCASPIIIDGQHIANVFIGQFLTSEPDMEYFENQAVKFCYDKDAYIDAIKQVPVIDEQKLPEVLGFLSGFTKLVTSLSLEKIKAKKVDKASHRAKLAALNLAEDANSAKQALIEHQEHLEELIVERTQDLDDERNFVNSVMNSQNNIVLTTNGESLRTANKALFDFYGISNVEEFMAKYGMCICDTFKTNAPEGFLQKMVEGQKWIDYVYENPAKIHKVMIEKESMEYIFTVAADRFRFKDEELSVAVFSDITEIEEQKKSLQNILDYGPLGIAFTSDGKFGYTNPEFKKMFDLREGDEAVKIYANHADRETLVSEIKQNGFVKNKELKFVSRGNELRDYLATFLPFNHSGTFGLMGFLLDITERKKTADALTESNKKIQDSIEYASLIQHSLIPSQDSIRAHFGEYFVIWHPKDIVGGDIYFFEELHDGNESILFVVDCTGHGVPGAFVTMLVKAIERQVTANIRLKNEETSPAKLLSIFNKNMKNLLKQESDESISNAGFDGAIIHYNKQTGVLKYAGAQIPLFYVDNGELTMVKADRHSIGYKKSNSDFEFTEHTIKTKEGMCFYITTDGYLDQNGGEKSFPFGKKRFCSIIEQNHKESFADQQEIFMDELQRYQQDEIRNDDITLIGFRV